MAGLESEYAMLSLVGIDTLMESAFCTDDMLEGIPLLTGVGIAGNGVLTPSTLSSTRNGAIDFQSSDSFK